MYPYFHSIKSLNLLFIAVFGFMALVSCGDSEPKKEAPDVSNIPMSVDIIRFDKKLMALDTSDNGKSLTMLLGEFPAFSDIYFTNVLGLKSQKDSVLDYHAVYDFINDEKVKNLQDTIDTVMDDLSQVKKDLILAFQYYRYYFPEQQIPNIYGCISGFDFQRFIFDDEKTDGIGLGLEMYLGNDFPYKQIDPQNPVFSDYLTKTFDKTHLPRKVMDLLIDDLVDDAGGVRLLDQMINNGKKLYLLEKVMPFIPDSVLFEYTLDQVNWCKENELEMWAFFFDQKLFYETNAVKINKYINASPNSPGMPEESPGRTANYMGYKIVQAFMKKFPNTTLEELINMKDAQKLLEDSKYKPKRK